MVQTANAIEELPNATEKACPIDWSAEMFVNCL